MYAILWSISVHCLLSSAQHTIANNGKNVLQSQNVNGGMVFPSQQTQFIQSNPAGVVPENLYVDAQQKNYPQIKNGIGIEDQYAASAVVDYKYHNYDKMTKLLRQITTRYPSLTALYSIGKSVQGKDPNLLFTFIRVLILIIIK